MIKNKEQKNDTLEQIKRLLVLALIHQGVQAKDIASVLEVDPAIISRMVPARQIKKKQN
jgi:Mn-dependent DtxR family transcriptional regulator